MKISIVSPSFNEKDNVKELYNRTLKVMQKLPQFSFEYIFIDNASTDGTIAILKNIAKEDSRVKVIINTRNFGHIRSPYWGIINAYGDVVIYLASDLQDPPELIPDFIEEWKKGYKIVLAVKPNSSTNAISNLLRKIYYKVLDYISETKIIKDATGFGLYDKKVIERIREIGDPYPFFRGLVCELGYKIKEVKFNQPKRKRGISKNNFYSLYDIGMLGLISHSKVLLRLSSLVGFIMSVISIFLAITYLFLKINNWNVFPPGIAPLIIATLMLFSILFGIIGILGEYILVIFTKINNRPIVVEDERINFD